MALFYLQQSMKAEKAMVYIQQCHNFYLFPTKTYIGSLDRITSNICVIRYLMSNLIVPGYICMLLCCMMSRCKIMQTNEINNRLQLYDTVSFFVVL